MNHVRDHLKFVIYNVLWELAHEDSLIMNYRFIVSENELKYTIINTIYEPQYMSIVSCQTWFKRNYWQGLNDALIWKNVWHLKR